MKPNGWIITIITYTVAVSVFFLGPALVISSIPLFILRYLIGKIAPRIKPDLGKILTTRSSILAADDIYKNPKNNLLLTATLEGNVDIQLAKDIVTKKAIEAKDPDSGKLEYPELQQYIISWCGFYFWKTDKTFDLNRHVKLYEKCMSEDDRFTDTEMVELREKLMNQPWDKEQPVWEMIFVRNFYPSGVDNPGPHTLFIWRIHHGLGDGYALLNLMTQKLCDNSEDFKNVMPEKVERSKGKKFLHILKSPFAMSYGAAEYFVMPLVTYPWRVPKKKRRDARYILDLTERIPVSKIREIKDHFKVSFSSVVFSVLAGAQRDMIIKKDYPLPKTVMTSTPLPIPGHSLKLRNYLTLVFIELPIGEADPIKRLKLCFEDYQRLKKSHTPLLFTYLMSLGGSYFTPIVEYFGANKALTTGLSSFPAGTATMYFAGLKGVDAMFCAELLQGCVGAGICGLSYVDGMRIAPIASTEMLNKEELREMTVSIQKQIDILYKHVA